MWFSAQRESVRGPLRCWKIYFARDYLFLSVFPPIRVEEQQLGGTENMKNTNQSSIALKTRVKAGSQAVNHNESVAVKTGLKSGTHHSGGGQGAG